ncbi:MAG: hypothetical protein Q8N81_05185 [bacterium]|nr:hypothetical protein [bacterium]
MQRKKPQVFKNGIDVGADGLVPGDIIFIEMVHLIPIGELMGKSVFECARACALFRFEGWFNLDRLFILGYGLHFDLEEGGVPTDVSCVNGDCIKQICVLTADHPAFIFMRALLELSERNRALAKENARLTRQNAQLVASHFGGTNTTQ